MAVSDEVEKVGTSFGRGVPNKIWEGKKCPKFGAVSDKFSL